MVKLHLAATAKPKEHEMTNRAGRDNHANHIPTAETTAADRAAWVAACAFCARVWTADGGFRTALDRTDSAPVYRRPAKKTAPAARPASEKQISFIESLMAKKDHHVTPEMLGSARDDSRKASALIDVLMAAGWKQTRMTTPVVELEAGMYSKDGTTIYKVYQGQSGRMLAKELVQGEGEGDWEFEYRGMASRFVKAADRMTLDDAREFGAIYGVCCRCGRTLTDEASIEAGIGPICAGKF